MTQDTFDALAFRSHFPHLDELAHLASCSQGALSRELHYSLTDLTRSLHLHGAPWGEWMEQVEKLRGLFASLINTTPEHIAIVSSASAGAFQVVSSFDWDGATVLTSSLEFPSIGQVLHAQRARGAEIEFIEDREAALETDNWSGRMTSSTKLVSVPLVSYHNGARPDVVGIVREARERGIATLVDAYQGAGVLPIDVQELDCDYLVTGALKYLLGLGGVAFLYVKDIGLAERVPESTGWFGRVDPFSFDPTDTSYPDSARRFEGGTPSVPAVYAGLAGLRLLDSVDQSRGYEHVMQLRDYFCDEVGRLGIEISQPADPQRYGPQVAVRLADPNAAAERLSQDKIVTAPRNDVLRMSLHYYTTSADVDRAVAALSKLG